MCSFPTDALLMALCDVDNCPPLVRLKFHSIVGSRSLFKCLEKSTRKQPPVHPSLWQVKTEVVLCML